jgi:DNA invertase Pin-like site-specific DNA recombinase
VKNLIYVRVSTDDQNCDLQRAACVKYCNERSLPFEIIEDVISGAKTSRPGFDSLMAQVRAGTVSRVIAYKLDRVGRSLPHLAMTLEEFKTWGTAVVFVSQSIDTSAQNPMASFQLNILMAFAQFERDLIRERVNAGIAEAKKRGVRFGRRLTHTHTPESICARLNAGESMNSIWKTTDVARGTLYRLAKQGGWKFTGKKFGE